MFDFFGYAVRNPSFVTRNARKAWATRKAMEAYRKDNPFCAATGKKTGCHVHHIRPVCVYPELASDEDNMITLHSSVHRIIGHGGNWKDYNVNVEKTARSMLIVETVGS